MQHRLLGSLEHPLGIGRGPGHVLRLRVDVPVVPHRPPEESLAVLVDDEAWATPARRFARLQPPRLAFIDVEVLVVFEPRLIIRRKV